MKNPTPHSADKNMKNKNSVSIKHMLFVIAPPKEKFDKA